MSEAKIKTQAETLMELVSMGEKISEPYPEGQRLIRQASRLKKLGFIKIGDQLNAEVSLKVKLSKITELKYICITPKKILAYLDRKVERYNKEHKPKEEPKKESYYNDISPRGVFPFDAWIDDLIERRRASGALAYQEAMYRMAMQRGAAVFNMGFDPAEPCPDYAPKSMPTHPEIFEKQTCDYRKTDPETIGKFVYTETPLRVYETIPPAEILKTLEEHSKRKCFDYFTIAKVNSVVDPILFGRVFNTNKRFFICQWGKDICLDDII